jgi:hypothetical protein
METRLGHAFSDVRVHADAAGARAADSVSAEAFTVGREVAFAQGRFAPATPAGERLLRHELTHVVQQRAAARATELTVAPPDAREREARAGAPRSALATQAVQRQAKEGTTTFTERVSQVTTRADQPGIVRGEVERRELLPSGDATAGAITHVVWDQKACRISIPVKVALRSPTPDQLSTATTYGAKSASAAPDAKARMTFSRYITAVNEVLNGWYTAVLTCDGAPCAGREMPIAVEVTEDAANPDYTVAVIVDAGSDGRSFVDPGFSTFGGTVALVGSGGDVSWSTLAHEGGHMTLGHGDEYREKKLPDRPIERVRESDFSLMAGAADFTGWAVLHERHLQFVTAFLRSPLVAHDAAGKACGADLKEVKRPPKLDFSVTESIGYASLGGRSGGYLSLGVDAALLDRAREVRASLGVHGTMMASLDMPVQTAFLLGVRAGLERRWTPSSGGVIAGGYVEGGRGMFAATGASPFTAPYADVGGRLGYGFAATGGVLPSLMLDAGAGTTLNPNDPQQQRWFRAGLTGRLEF